MDGQDRTEAAVILFETGMHPAFAWGDSPCMGDFKTLDISDVKTGAFTSCVSW